MFGGFSLFWGLFACFGVGEQVGAVLSDWVLGLVLFFSVSRALGAGRCRAPPPGPSFTASAARLQGSRRRRAGLGASRARSPRERRAGGDAGERGPGQLSLPQARKGASPRGAPRLSGSGAARQGRRRRAGLPAGLRVRERSIALPSPGGGASALPPGLLPLGEPSNPAGAEDTRRQGRFLGRLASLAVGFHLPPPR